MLLTGRPGPRAALFTLVAVAALTARPSSAAGMDRDTLLTDAPATPSAGTLRFSGSALGTTSAQNASSVGASLMWAPAERVAADFGAYYQTGTVGPTARVRFQLLSQGQAGVDLAAGLRYKSVGFDPQQGEFEALLAAGRSFGRFDLVLNGAFGMEVSGPGRDAEIKTFAGYRLFENVRAGLDGRLQGEFRDENGYKRPQPQDIDLIAGPAVSCLVTRRMELQALAGVAKPKGSVQFGPTVQALASYDF